MIRERCRDIISTIDIGQPQQVSSQYLIGAEGHVFDGERAVSDDAERHLFNALLFGCCPPTDVASDLLNADGIDLRRRPSGATLGRAPRW